MPQDATAELTRDQWAWEFLRRNPDYRDDYRRFMEIWRTLEAAYGAPPQRDFQRWKRDPRAYGPLPGNGELAAPTGELCVVEDDRVLLECWMGAKWGFYKFPLDPAHGAPSPDELSWRPPSPLEPRSTDDPLRVDITFDLALPLPPQLDAAKFRLVGRAAELRRTGVSAPLTVANQRAHWSALLRVLDAAAAGESLNANGAALLDEARTMTQRGYLDILRLA